MSLLLREAIGGSIRRARTERRRTLRDVSKEARVSLGYLSEIERGRKEPSSELLAAICEALSLPLPELLDEVADVLRPAPRPVPAGVGAGASRGASGTRPVWTPRCAPRSRRPSSPRASGDDASAGMSASMSATLPAPPEPEEPAAPRTVALPEPEGLPQRDPDEEVVAPVEGATTVRLVGLAGGATSGPRSPVVRVAA